ncbi:hypothetical protein M2347_000990 [Chryseobacterium sp. H1D6B]|uniref:hypothetical protein n=1 Tax=Chryseobacterium sp. H1D6B TaxID=2940588 RepID=UPI0015CDA6DA|nr:hypothetical protein [Chryseobacterium sp. H1D6B]MDH6251263.1 hypothetical protein [Chryseobacterium sp. H1D6B]
MNNDQFQNKYDEVFKEIKEEKMDWDFEDFLQKAEPGNREAEIIPLQKKKPSYPKWVWMAAGLLVLLSIGFLFNNDNQNGTLDKETLVKNEIEKQKSDFIKENQEHQEQVAVNHIDNDTITEAKKDSIFQENSLAEKDVLDQILPKRGRLKKAAKPRFVDNSSSKKYNSAVKESSDTGYQDNYVIVNGKKIESVEEAINVTKYSFQIFANNVSEKLVQPKVMDEN